MEKHLLFVHVDFVSSARHITIKSRSIVLISILAFGEAPKLSSSLKNE